MSNALEEKPKTEEKPLTIDPKGAEEFMMRQMGEPMPAAKEDKKEEKPAAKVEKPVVVAKKVKAKSKPAVVEPEPPDYDGMTEAVSRGVAAALKPKEEEKVEAKDDEGMSEDDKELLPILTKMAELRPDRYKNLRRDYIINRKAILDYQKQWEKENPDKEFNDSDEEHNAFFDKHSVDWKDGDEVAARAEIIADRRVEKALEGTKQELGAIKKRALAQESEPQAWTEKKRNGKKMVEGLGDEFKALINEDGTPNKELIAKLRKDDPLAADVVLPQLGQLEELAAESYRLHQGIVDFDMNNPAHKYLNDFALKETAAIQALPKAEQRDDKGRMFASTMEYGKMSKDKQAKHYTLTYQDLNNLLTAEIAGQTRKFLMQERQKFEEKAKVYGYAKNGNGKPPAVKEEVEKPEMVTSIAEPITTGDKKASEHQPQDGMAGWMNKQING